MAGESNLKVDEIKMIRTRNQGDWNTPWLRQTVNESRAGAGTWSSIFDYRNNVHWLTANIDDCFLFTSKLIRVERKRELNGRINVDVHRAVQLGKSTIRTPKITSREAAEIYEIRTMDQNFVLQCCIGHWRKALAHIASRYKKRPRFVGQTFRLFLFAGHKINHWLQLKKISKNWFARPNVSPRSVKLRFLSDITKRAW